MKIDRSFFLLHKTPILLVVTSILFYFSFAYDLERTDLLKLVSLYAGLFFLFYKILQITKHNIKFLTWTAFVFRAVFLLSIPNLSQDFYRFIWDGRMILAGFNPYLYTVDYFSFIGPPIEQGMQLQAGMGDLNASHYSNYPPINQLYFVLAGLFAGKSILGSALVMRLVIIAADFGTLYFGKRLLEKLNIPAHHIFWYILNPFIIIELTGNLHFEGVMIFFLIWSLYLLHSGKWQLSAVIFALSVSVKLIPLIFLPLFYQWFINKKTREDEILKPRLPGGQEVQDDKNVNVIAIPRTREKQSVSMNEITSSIIPHNDVLNRILKLIGFYLIVVLVALISFVPFYSTEFLNNYTQTVGLWFQNFEFNASLYYIARTIGYTFRGYNEIAIIGKYIALIVIVFILILAFFRRNRSTIQLITAMLLVLSFYYFTATTVHPWYVATLLILSVFTKYKFPLVWSFVIILSYLAYGNTDNTENLWIIALEYVVVYGIFIWEVSFKKTIK
jgi:hypothetical protein